MSTCQACGKQVQGGISMGGVLLCRPCAADIEIEIKQLHEQGKQVNVANIARRIFRETYSSGDYLLRDIPEELWNDAKRFIIGKNMSLRDLILESLRKYMSSQK